MARAKKTNISVIIPVHEINEQTEELFKKAVQSVERQKVKTDELLIVTPKGSAAFDYLSKFDFGKVKTRIIENEGQTDFSSQINLGVENLTSDWFTILEFDDELADIWLDNVVKYREAYEDVELFLPIIVDVKEDGNFMNLTNEAVWAQSFSDEIGYLDTNALLAYQNFNIDGLAMSKDKFQEIGGFKANIKLTFIYEFLLRATFQSTITMVIPKYGYKHINQRVGSLFETYKHEMTSTEANWWLETAKKEYFHSEDRELKYEE
jgi:hypothetical protein